MFQIERQTFVEVIRGHILQLVAFVMGCVVQQHADRARAFGETLNGGFQRRNVAQIDLQEVGGVMTCRLHFFHNRMGRIGVIVDEADARALCRELHHMFRPDPACPAGNQHGAAFQAGVDRKFAHGFSPPITSETPNSPA